LSWVCSRPKFPPKLSSIFFVSYRQFPKPKKGLDKHLYEDTFLTPFLCLKSVLIYTILSTVFGNKY
jgi:hypothetical protein